MSARQFHCQAGEYTERLRQAEAERTGKVVRFLRDNPLSTAEEVFKATGCGVVGMKYLTHTKYNGKTVWRLNHRRLKQEGLE